MGLVYADIDFLVLIQNKKTPHFEKCGVDF